MAFAAECARVVRSVTQHTKVLTAGSLIDININLVRLIYTRPYFNRVLVVSTRICSNFRLFSFVKDLDEDRYSISLQLKVICNISLASNRMSAQFHN